MTAAVRDPVREFEHTHEHLTGLALEAGRLLRVAPNEPLGEEARRRLRACLKSLRDELLRHFAVEEEGLFPFIRANLPARAGHVERLAVAHDAICGAVVRLAHAAEATRGGGARAALVTLYERFDNAYALHSREEADLFSALRAALDAGQKAQLAELLRGL
jgi:iron-sulfur cluster repair protein YtfE (RIC family)